MTRGPRILLRQIREALGGAGAGATPAQDRLNMVVQIIARSMVAEVCSIYLRRASGELELFATEGLNPEAVHNTRLRPGEGLVGEVARMAQPISLSDAPASAGAGRASCSQSTSRMPWRRSAGGSSPQPSCRRSTGS